jgi:hypothetical protein
LLLRPEQQLIATHSQKDKRCNVTSEEAKGQMQFIEKILTEAF